MRTGVAALGGVAILIAAALGIRWFVAPQEALPPTTPGASVPVPSSEQPGTAQVASVDLVDAERLPSRELDAVQPTLPPFDAAAVGRSGQGDAEFDAVVGRLRVDPDALRALVDEARAETDLQRLAFLLRVLGDVDDPSVVALAAELIYSGDPAARALGLDLLKRIQPGNPDVLAIVSGLLVSESDPAVLVPTMTALARPGEIEAAERATLVEQVAILTDHPEASVRRTSIDILARWSTDPAYTPRLLAGLSDEDPTVKRTAAYAFVDRDSTDLTVRRELFDLAADASTQRVTRRGALLSLRSMELDEDELARVDRLSRGLDRRAVRQ